MDEKCGYLLRNVFIFEEGRRDMPLDNKGTSAILSIFYFFRKSEIHMGHF